MSEEVMNSASVAETPEKADEQTPIIFLDDIKVTFRTRTGSLLHPNLVHAVRGLTLKLMPGETIGIVGEYIGKIYLETKARPKYIIETVLD